MADQQVLDRARDAVSQILGFLGITRVVCVDDEYTDAPSVEDAIAAAGQLTHVEIRAALPEVGEAPLDDPDIRDEHIRRTLAGLDTKLQHERNEKLLTIARLKGGAATDDTADASVLEQLVPKSQLMPLTAQRWREQGAALLEEDSEHRTLFLFDQDLSKDSGEPTEGMKIISAVIAGDSGGTRICGLLTHTVTPENEQEQWKQLARDFGVPIDRFIVVPKGWLGRDPLVFAQRLKLVALSPDFAKLKKKAADIVGHAAGVASAQVAEISIYDLDHIVFRVATTEGLWEPDMLFRLHSLFSRSESRRLAHEAGELESIAKRLRSVSHIPTDSESRPALTTWGLQRRELYESVDYLNGNHLPIELGDIFAKTGSDSKKAYILLAQPCDIMVRQDGRRQPEVEFLTLAEIVPAADEPKNAAEIDYFGDGPGDRYFVKMKAIHQVKACILDLCALDANGTATIEIGKACPDGLRPSWLERYHRLMTMYERKLTRLKPLWPEYGESGDDKRKREAIWKMVLSGMLDVGPFKGQVSDTEGRKTVTYNCRRIGRLVRERAFGLLMAYTSCLSRPGFDRDFGKPLPESVN